MHEYTYMHKYLNLTAAMQIDFLYCVYVCIIVGMHVCLCVYMDNGVCVYICMYVRV